MNKIVAAILSLSAASAFATSGGVNSGDNWRNTTGFAWKNGDGTLCWRDATWTPATAATACDGGVAKAAPAAAPAPAAPRATTPAPVAPATAPRAAAPTAPVAAAPAAAPKRCDFALNFVNAELFAFDKAVLTAGAKQRLDNEVMAKLGACKKVDLVIVTGHTDRLGTPQYNQKLSEKRANVVAAYLKAKGVSADIDILGAGKTQPVAGVVCDDKLARPKLIECLAPHRRVTVEGRGLAK